jgi:large subunit ribosomal protein L33
MAKKQDRIIIYLACTECKERNYTSSKNKRNDPNRLEFDKFCPRCRQHRLHRETK